MSDWLKIAIACFIGGVTCSGVALLVSPAYWWLGLLAGFAGGYVSFEFTAVPAAVKKVLANIPERKKVRQFIADCELQRKMKELWNGIKATFVVLFALVGIFGLMVSLMTSIAFWGAPVGYRTVAHNTIHDPWTYVYTLAVLIAIICIYIAAGGADTKKDKREALLVGLGVMLLTPLPGLVTSAPVFGIGCTYYILAKIIWPAVRAIHSSKRILCGVDGMLGGAASYIWLITPEASISQRVMLILFGGLLGSAFGVLNFEVVSKRLLKLFPKPDPTPAIHHP